MGPRHSISLPTIQYGRGSIDEDSAGESILCLSDSASLVGPGVVSTIDENPYEVTNLLPMQEDLILSPV